MSKEIQLVGDVAAYKAEQLLGVKSFDWCDEDCIIKDKNTDKAIKTAVKAERFRIMKELNKEFDYVETSTDFTRKEKSAIQYTIGRIQNRIKGVEKVWRK